MSSRGFHNVTRTAFHFLPHVASTAALILSLLLVAGVIGAGESKGIIYTPSQTTASNISSTSSLTLQAAAAQNLNLDAGGNFLFRDQDNSDATVGTVASGTGYARFGDSTAPTVSLEAANGLTVASGNVTVTSGTLSLASTQALKFFGNPVDIIFSLQTARVAKAYNTDLFNAAGLTDSANIWLQPANTIFLGMTVRLYTQFAATDLTDIDVTVGDAGDADGILAATMNATSDAIATKYKTKGASFDSTAGTLLKETATQWLAYSTAVGANLNTLTAGEMVFEFLYIQL